MSKTVGIMNWKACYDCKHYLPDKGGCDVMESGLEQFRLVYGIIECTKYEEVRE